MQDAQWQWDIILRVEYPSGIVLQIAGMTEEEFIKYLGQNHISVFKYDNKEEFLEELNNA